MESEIQDSRFQNAAGALATQFEAKPNWHGRSEGKPEGGGSRRREAARPRRPTGKTQDIKIQETRGGRALWRFRTWNGCSEAGLGQNVAAAGSGEVFNGLAGLGMFQGRAGAARPSYMMTRAGRPCPPLEEVAKHAPGPLGTRVPA